MRKITSFIISINFLLLTACAGTTSLSDGAGLEIEHSSLNFLHKKGISSCPQNIGSITLKNKSKENILAEVSTVSESIEFLGKNNFSHIELSPIKSSNIDLNYNCQLLKEFSDNIMIANVTADTETNLTVFGQME